MAKRALTPEELSELDQLRQRSILIWGFMARKDQLVRTLAPEAKKAVEEAYRKHDLRALRRASRDDAEWIESLSPGDQQQLKSMIAALGQGEPGKDWTDSSDDIRRIVARGKIRNADEHRMILSRVEQIHRDSDSAEEVQRLNALLLDFESAAL